MVNWKNLKNGKYHFVLSRNNLPNFSVSIDFKVNADGKISHDEINVNY